MSKGLKAFLRTLKEFKTLSGYMLKGVIAVPLATVLTQMGPPPSVITGALSALSTFLVTVWVFHFWHDEPKSRLNRRMKWSIVVAVLAGIGYGLSAILSLMDTDRGVIVRGYSLLPEVQQLIDAGKLRDAREALGDHAYDPSEVYTQFSLAVTHVTLVLLWLVTFVAIGMFISIFIILRGRDGSDRTAPTRPAGPPAIPNETASRMG